MKGEALENGLIRFVGETDIFEFNMADCRRMAVHCHARRHFIRLACFNPGAHLFAVEDGWLGRQQAEHTLPGSLRTL